MPMNDTDILQPANTDGAFEQLYIDVRSREQRVYTDEEVKQLPDISPAHVHYKEWLIRKRSVDKLVTYLTRKNKPLNILEIGCGNGWLAAKLADIAGTKVTALDINKVEIDQAKRVFKKDNLQFGDYGFEPEQFSWTKFDIILFAASIQYFSPVQEMIAKALSCLSDDGEIHIIDSNFYKADEIEGAKKRTHDYFKSMNSPQMAAYYFHHQLNDLRGFNYRIINDPNSILNKLTKRSPFYWVRIKNQ